MAKNQFIILIITFLNAGIIDIPTSIVKGFSSIEVPSISLTKDTVIKASFTIDNVNTSYVFIVDYQTPTSNSYVRLFEDRGMAKQKTCKFVFPVENAEIGSTLFRFILDSSAFTNGTKVELIEGKSTSNENIALANNFVTSFVSEKTYSKYSNLKNSVTSYAETFNFYNFEKEQTQSYYNYLDINNFYLTYSFTPKSYLPYKECYIYLQNVNNWFSEVGTSFGQFRKIPLKLNFVNGEYHFVLSNALYIDPTTNKMSSNYQDNYVLTNKLFLPKNGFNDVTNIRINLVVKQLGYNELTLSQNFVFDIKSNYFGNCYDSEYCIQGDLVHPNFDYGIVEEH